MSDELRARGTALAERVAAQVDVAGGLERIEGRRRRGRALVAAAGAAFVVLAIVAAVWLLAPATSELSGPAAPETRDAATPLPVTFYVALIDDFVVDGAQEGRCVGSGVHAGVAQGTGYELVDRRQRVVVAGVFGEPGMLIDAARVRALGLDNTESACLFEIGDVRLHGEPAEVVPSSLGGQPWPLPGVVDAGGARVGQQIVFYSRGGQA
jgi:hypothetical protein